jgi:hypothetical protein
MTRKLLRVGEHLEAKRQEVRDEHAEWAELVDAVANLEEQIAERRGELGEVKLTISRLEQQGQLERIDDVDADLAP